MNHFTNLKHFTPAEIFAQNDKDELLDIFVNDNIYDNMIRLLWLLDDIRTLFFFKPIYITSFYRNSKHNTNVGGVFNSYHMLGAAVDVTCSDIPALLHLLSDFLGLVKYIHYPDKNFVHIQLKDPKK